MINMRADALVLHGADTGVDSISNAGSVMHTVTRKVITAASLIIGEGRTRRADGVVVSTSIAAGGYEAQHAEGVVVSTSVTAGGLESNHSEGVVVSTSVIAGGIGSNHSEMLVEHRLQRRISAQRSAVLRFQSGRRL